MKLRVIFLTGAAALLTLSLLGCDGNWCIGDNCLGDCDDSCGSCSNDWDDCSDWGNDWDENTDWDNDWDDDSDWNDNDDGNYTWCDMQHPCPEGMICTTDERCLQIVENCPLTDECLGDPDGYTPDWQGIDPIFIGEFHGDDLDGKVDVLLDFYDDHIYGNINIAVQLINSEGLIFYDYSQGTVTGTRDGATLWGQLVMFTSERTFDATFDAQLLSASEIEGTVRIDSDDGTYTARFRLFRTTPCGCDTSSSGCESNSDCQEGSICLDGECLQVCVSDEDCADGQVCENHECVEGCSSECCADDDCTEGDVCIDGACAPACQLDDCCEDQDCELGYECVDGQCLNPCVHWCDCAEGEDCIDGYCRPSA